MNLLCRRSFFWSFLFVVTPFIHTFSQGTLSFKVTEIICPKVCLGENRYRIVFSVISAEVSTNKGRIQNDTIVDIDPGADYKVVVTIRPNDTTALIRQEVIPLPICDPILPDAPLAVSQSSCEGQPIPPLIAFVKENETVDWYDKPTGGILLAKATLQYISASSGMFYAEARRIDSGCKSLSRTPARLDIQRVMCIPITVKKVRQ